MPTTNPVYQPTTVTYERHKEWSSNYIERMIPGCYQKPYLQRLLLVGAALFAMLGLGLAIYALVNDMNTHTDEDPMSTFSDNSSEDYEREETPDAGDHDHQMNVVLGSVGICLVLIGLVMYLLFLKLRGMCCRGPQHQRATVGAAPLQVHADGSPATAVSYKEVQVS